MSATKWYPVFLGTLAAAAFSSAGCASWAPMQPEPGEVHEVATRSEWEYVQVTGSNIPVRVPKSPTAHPLPLPNNVHTLSPEDFRRIVQRGRH